MKVGDLVKFEVHRTILDVGIVTGLHNDLKRAQIEFSKTGAQLVDISNPLDAEIRSIKRL